METDRQYPYEWMLVVGAFGAFAFGFGTGSNDVANSFATSVGSGTLSMNQALIMAAIFEFLGAMVLGNNLSNVIASGIAELNTFNNEKKRGPYLYAYGLMWVMWVGGLWQIFASVCELNVSATHSVIGGIIGFAMVHAGKDGVNWAKEKKNSVPPYEGVIPVVVAWFFAPIATAIASFTIFMSVRTIVLRSANSVRRSYWVLPAMIFITIWINCFFVFTKGAKKSIEKDGQGWDDNKSQWVAAIVAAGCSVLSIAAFPLIAYRVADRMILFNKTESDRKALEEDKIASPDSLEDNSTNDTGLAERHLTEADKAHMAKENEMDEFDPELAEKFNREAEMVFSYLQVISAISVIFAHGTNEVGYAAGPLAVIFDVVSAGPGKKMKKSVTPTYWMLFIVAAAMVIGLATYGRVLTLAYGFRMAKLSASRGFSAELATAIVVTVAAQYGLPTSTSQCITGGIIGVGCAEYTRGVNAGVNWKYFFLNFLSWIVTIFFMAIMCAFLYAQGTYAPLEENP